MRSTPRPASRPSPRPAQVLVDGTTRRLTTSAIRFEDAGEHQLKGKVEPERAVAGDPCCIGDRRRATGRRPGGTTDRPRRRDAHDSRTVPCVRRAPTAAVGARVRPGRRRQEPAGVGVREVHRRTRRHSCCGTAAAASPTATGWCSGRSPRPSVGASTSPRRTSRRWSLAKLASGLERYVPDPEDRAFIGVRLGRLLGARFAGDPGGELHARRAVRRVATVLRALGVDDAGGDPHRRCPSRPCRAARVHRPSRRLGA